MHASARRGIGQIDDRPQRRVDGERLREIARRSRRENARPLRRASALVMSRSTTVKRMPSGVDELRDRRLGGKLGAVGCAARRSRAARPCAAPSSATARSAPCAPSCDVAKARRQQDGEVPPDRVARAVAEDLLGAAIEVDDPLRLVDRDDRVGGDARECRRTSPPTPAARPAIRRCCPRRDANVRPAERPTAPAPRRRPATGSSRLTPPTEFPA